MKDKFRPTSHGHGGRVRAEKASCHKMAEVIKRHIVGVSVLAHLDTGPLGLAEVDNRELSNDARGYANPRSMARHASVVERSFALIDR